MRIETSHETVLVQPLREGHHPSDARLSAIYQVSVRMYDDGTACTTMHRLDGPTHRLVAVELGCYAVLVPSEVVALDCIVDATLARRQDISPPQ